MYTFYYLIFSLTYKMTLTSGADSRGGGVSGVRPHPPKIVQVRHNSNFKHFIWQKSHLRRYRIYEYMQCIPFQAAVKMRYTYMLSL